MATLFEIFEKTIPILAALIPIFFAMRQPSGKQRQEKAEFLKKFIESPTASNALTKEISFSLFFGYPLNRSEIERLCRSRHPLQAFEAYQYSRETFGFDHRIGRLRYKWKFRSKKIKSLLASILFISYAAGGSAAFYLMTSGVRALIEQFYLAAFDYFVVGLALAGISFLALKTGLYIVRLNQFYKAQRFIEIKPKK